MSKAVRAAHRLERRQPATTRPDVVHGICRGCGRRRILFRDGRTCCAPLSGMLAGSGVLVLDAACLNRRDRPALARLPMSAGHAARLLEAKPQKGHP
jgi:hypothetical protein